MPQPKPPPIRFALPVLAVLFAAQPAWAAPAAAAGRQVAIVTIADGDATLIRGATRYALVEGVKLRAEDIVETGADTRLLRIESPGDALDLGPGTRLMLAPPLPAARSATPPRAYLLRGWAKWTAAQPPTGALLGAGVDVDGLTRSAVIARIDAASFVFAESGDLRLVEHAGGRDTTRALPSGRFYAQPADGAGSIGARPSADFMAKLPRPFVDTLPSRAARFASQDIAPRPIGDIDYADAQPWVDAEPALRRGFVVRWRARAAVPAFRKGLVAGIAAHPEWDRTLFPEKYLPRHPPAASSPVASRTP